MELKNDLTADAIGNLYRAALYFGRDSKETGLGFFNKAKAVLGKKVLVEINSNNNNSKVTAEHILDEYKRLKYNLKSI